MKSTSLLASILSPVLMALVVAGCSPESRRDNQINDYVESVGTLDVPAPSLETTNPTPEAESGPYLCSTQTITQTKLFDSFPAQGAVAKRIYPGALLDGNSLAGGVFNEIPLPRKPVTLSINLDQATTSAIMENPSLSAFLDARQSLIFQGIDEGQANGPKFSDVALDSSVSEEELSLTLGFDVSAGVVSNVDVAGQFNFNDQTKRSRYLIRMIDELYTVAIDKPAFASDFLSDEVTVEDVQRRFGAGNPPVYVDTVTYGRTVYIAVESTFSAQELQAALSATVESAIVDATLDFGLTAREVLEEVSIQGVVVGGSDEDRADLGNLRDPQALINLAQRVPVVDRQNFGEPVSFTVAYLADNSSTVSPVIGTFDAETCRRGAQDFIVKVQELRIDDIEDQNTIGLAGSIAVSFEDSSALLFDHQSDFIFVDEGEVLTGDLSVFSPDIIEGVDLQSDEEIALELNLVAAPPVGSPFDSPSDSLLSETVLIPAGNLADRQETISFSGAGITGTLSLSFEPIVTAP